MNKVNISSMRVLQMLQLLFEKSYTMNDLMAALSEVTGEECSNFLVSKYINTCRFCGIDIQKINGEYTLLKLPFGINFTDDELKLLSLIGKDCLNIRVSKTVKSINSLIKKIHKHTDRYYAKINIPEDDANITNFEKACENGVKTEFKYTEEGTQYSIICEPLELAYEDDHLGFIVNHNGERKRIIYEDTQAIVVTDIKSSNNLISTNVVFKLKSVLAKRYTLRPEERVVGSFDDGSINILNKTEDKKSLLNRLLKYGELCEVVSPKSYKKEMLSIIDKTLENYK